MRVFAAFRAFFSVLFGRAATPAQATAALPAPAPAPAQLAAPAALDPAVERRAEARGALQLLQLLQREGRLVDFL